MSEPVLQAEGLVRSFAASGGPEVLSDMNLSVSAGESLAITGVSGCGKSTLLHILGGLARPDSGEVKVAGTDINTLSVAKQSKLRSAKLGFVYQDHHLLGEFSAAENVAMGPMIAGKSRDEAIARAKELLASVGLSSHASRTPAQLSGGERQRAAIARALANEPACVIADEPTGNLDRDSAASVADLLLDICATKGCSLVVATHDLEFASKLSRRLELREGKLVSVAGK